MNNYLAHVYDAIVLRVVDGDSCWVHLDFTESVDLPLIDVGFRLNIGGGHLVVHGAQDLEIRVAGINAPEMSTAAGKVAKAYAETLLPPGLQVRARTYKPTQNAGAEKYGRWLADITLPDGTNFAQAMTDSGHAVPYFP